jgi:hypothetical protein
MVFGRASVERPWILKSLVESWSRRWGSVFYSPGLRDSSLFCSRHGTTGIEPFRSKYVSQNFFTAALATSSDNTVKKRTGSSSLHPTPRP